MDPQKTPTDQTDNNTAAPGMGQEPSAQAFMGVTPDVLASETPARAPSVIIPGGDSGQPAATAGTPVGLLALGKKKGRRKKGLIFGLIITAIVLLLSGGAAASYYYYVANKPESILKQALANSIDPEKVKTSHSSGTMVFGNEEMTVETTYSVKVDNQSGAFDMTSKADALVTNLTLDARSLDGKTFYFKPGGLDGLAGLLGAAGDLSGMTLFSEMLPLFDLVNNQWIEVNQSLFKQSDPAFVSGVLSDADKRKIAEAYLQNPFLVIKDVMADGEIKGQASYHYKVQIDPAGLKAFAAALKAAGLDVYKLEQKHVGEIHKLIDQAEFDKYPFEVWIAKDTKLFTQLRIALTEGGFKADIKHTIESYNQPVQVGKPEDSKSILEIIGEFSKVFSEEYGDFFSDPALQGGSGISL